jgi:single-strand DNA-binding protein
MRALKVHGCGYATANPELRNVGANNRDLCTVNLAFNRSFKSGDEWKKETTFMQCQAWNGVAKRMNQFITKGTPVFVEGRIRQNNWETTEGQKRTSHVIVVDNFNVLEKMTRVEDETAPVGVGNNNNNNNDDDEEVPF